MLASLIENVIYLQNLTLEQPISSFLSKTSASLQITEINGF